MAYTNYINISSAEIYPFAVPHSVGLRQARLPVEDCRFERSLSN